MCLARTSGTAGLAADLPAVDVGTEVDPGVKPAAYLAW